MFDIINSLRSDIARTPIQPIPTAILDRRRAMEDIVNSLYTLAAPDHHPAPDNPFDQNRVLIELYPSVAPGGAGSIHHHEGSFVLLVQFAMEKLLGAPSFFKTVMVPPLWLIHPDEIPEQFQFTDINDPRLDNLDLLQQFSDWICEYTGFPTQQLPPIQKEDIQNALSFLQDREKAKKAIKFILMHELGHIHNGDTKNSAVINFLLTIGSAIFSLSWPICVAIALVLPVTGLVWPVVVAIPLVITAAIVSHCAITFIGKIFYNMGQELAADAFAARFLPDGVEGGIYAFETLLKEAPDAPASLTHPNNASRIAALEAYRQEQLAASQTPSLVPQPV